MWTQLAIATVSTTIGEMAEGAVIESPTQPPIPTALMTDSATTSMIANVALKLRTSSTSISVIAAKLAGTSVFRSPREASMKAWLKITRPVIRTSMPGKRSRTSSASPRANSTTRGPSSTSSSPGSCTMTLIPPTPASRARRRAASRGSARAMARIRDRSPGSSRSASSTRSRTRMSSPSAVVCWKLVTESTRVEYGICQDCSVSHAIASSARAEVASRSCGAMAKKTLPLFPYVFSIASYARSCGLSSEK